MVDILDGDVDGAKGKFYKGFLSLDQPSFTGLSPQEYGVVEVANGLKFATDAFPLRLKHDALPVSPQHGKAWDLLDIAESLGEKFDNVEDLASGGGEAMLLIVNSGVAKKGVGIDINRRAVDFARLNAKINGISNRVVFRVGDLRGGTGKTSDKGTKKTLFVGNALFVLPVLPVKNVKNTKNTKNTKIEIVDFNFKGEDPQRLFSEYVWSALRAAKAGDAIIALCQSEIGVEGEDKTEGRIRKLLPPGCSCEIKQDPGYLDYVGVVIRPPKKVEAVVKATAEKVAAVSQPIVPVARARKSRAKAINL